jgi:phytoene/squalene synthetase
MDEGVAGSTGQARPAAQAPPASGIAVAAEVSLAAAAKASGENFPVALRVLPGAWRAHLTALYGFARLTDDLGDEPLPGMPPGASPETIRDTRLRLLDDLQQDLARIYEGGQPELPAVRALQRTVSECGIPRRPFDDLIQANRQDQLVTRYQTYDDLRKYCELSANPVGQVVLYIAGAATPERLRLSDSVVELMTFQTRRARRLLDEGAPLTGTLRGAARLAVSGYVAGGRAALSAIARAGYDVLRQTPKPGKAATLANMVSCYVRGR